MRSRVPFTIATTCLAVLSLAGCGPKEIRYHPNGVRASEGRRGWISGAEEDLWTYWYGNGSPREEGACSGGQREEMWTQWYPDGQKRSAGQRAFDETTGGAEREGPWTFWQHDGQVIARGAYERGKRRGDWRYWRSDGSYDTERSGSYVGDRRVGPAD